MWNPPWTSGSPLSGRRSADEERARIANRLITAYKRKGSIYALKDEAYRIENETLFASRLEREAIMEGLSSVLKEAVHERSIGGETVRMSVREAVGIDEYADRLLRESSALNRR